MKKIRLTESQFNKLIKETVRDILNEDSTYTQLVNTFGKDFDEEWNVIRNLIPPEFQIVLKIFVATFLCIQHSVIYTIIANIV